MPVLKAWRAISAAACGAIGKRRDHSVARFNGTATYVATDDLRVAVNAAMSMDMIRELMNGRMFPVTLDGIGHAMRRLTR